MWACTGSILDQVTELPVLWDLHPRPLQQTRTDGLAVFPLLQLVLEFLCHLLLGIDLGLPCTTSAPEL